MFQGGKRAEAKNRFPAGVNLSKLNAVLLTHAHLDHTGRVPLLVKHGFAGRVLATAAPIDLAELILQDSARLQAQDAQTRESLLTRCWATFGGIVLTGFPLHLPVGIHVVLHI
jgi:Cft2 family RNA processing exonuclease